MKHQPFERWILLGPPLTVQEKAEMDDHLARCPDCRTLQDGVRRAEVAVRGASLAEPREGFVTRWRIRLDQETNRRKREMAWWTFAWTTLAAVPIAIALAWRALTVVGSFPALLADGLQLAIRWWTWLRLTGEIGRTFVLTDPLPLLSGALFGWMVLIASAASLAVAWSALMVRYSPQGGRQ